MDFVHSEKADTVDATAQEAVLSKVKTGDAGGSGGVNLRLDVGSRSDIGRVRANNEDTCRVNEDSKLFVIADGMGGEAHGELASGIAGDAVAGFCAGNVHHENEEFEFEAGDEAGELIQRMAARETDAAGEEGLSEKTRRLGNAARLANRRIFECAMKDPQLRGMGATLVAAWVDGARMSLVNVGDSRAYLVRDGELKQLTNDHTLVEEQVRRGLIKPEDAHRSKMQNVLIRALGVKSEVELDAAEFELQGGDILLLCTDGLTRMAGDGEIGRVLMGRGGAQEKADGLVKLANEKGGDDNVSVIVVGVE